MTRHFLDNRCESIRQRMVKLLFYYSLCERLHPVTHVFETAFGIFLFTEMTKWHYNRFPELFLFFINILKISSNYILLKSTLKSFCVFARGISR